ncbi:MAG: hypothetical protein GYB68_17155 [Chloroflexi bacterium]|nr:hypothetical protein [Chloroflexota bacterium]
MTDLVRNKRPFGEAFGFDEADLRANARGDLTPAQVARARYQAMGWLGGSLVMPFVWSILLILIAGTNDIGILLLLASIIFAVSYSMNFRRSINLLRDLAAGQVDELTGTVFEVPVQIRLGGRSSIIGLGDQRFPVSPVQYHSFTMDEPATVYYLPRARYIVSAEAKGTSTP